MKISIIIIEYFCMKDAMHCVESVKEHLTDIQHEVVLLSNSCYGNDQLTRYRERIGPMVKLVSAGGNLGYAGGVNAALREVDGDYIYILNPDCILKDGSVAEILDRMENEDNWVVSGPKVIDDENQVQPSCRRFPRPWTFLFVRTFLSKTSFGKAEKNYYFMNDFDHDVEREVDWVSGGALIAKAEVVKQLGGMDSRYFLYMEDVDLCRTMREKGYKIKYCPTSTVVHAGQHASVKGGISVIFSRSFRLHITSLVKYFSKWGIG